MAWYIPVLIFLARICDVSIGTVRMIYVINGARAIAAALGFIEVLIWALAVGGVIHHLTNPFALAGYAGGFATGVLIGMTIEERIAVGFRTVRVINTNRDLHLAREIRRNDYRATRIEGEGANGPVELVFITVRRRQASDLLQLIRQIAPEAFVTVERADHAGAALVEPGAAATRTLWGRLSTLRK
jgi:uncharacterized protein YebE (UPF0316 family)